MSSYYEKFADGKVVCIDDEIPFEIPARWGWARLRDVVHNHGQKTPSADFCYIDIGSIDNKRQVLSDTENVISPKEAPSRARKIVKEGDVIYSTVRPYLHNVAIIDRSFSHEPIASTGFAVLSCEQSLLNRYLFFFLISPEFDAYANDGDNAKGVAYPAINDEKLYKALVPIPPIYEQQRIIDKIDKLLPFIYKYDKCQESLESINDNIIKLIKKSVLQEAIQGKLVPQNPEDEPAEKLLKRIDAEKQRLVKEGKLKAKDAVASTIFKSDDNKYYEQIGSIKKDITDAIPYEIPDSWAFTRLSAVIELLSGRDLEPSKYNSIGKGIPYITGASNIEESITVSRWTEYPTTISHMGDLLITCKGTVGTMAINNIGNIHIARQIMSITSILCNIDYIRYVIESQMVFLKKEARSMIPGISREHILELILPLPPLGEQARIVNRIKELQALLN